MSVVRAFFSRVRKILERSSPPVERREKKPKLPPASASDVVRLDYPAIPIYIRATSPMERMWRAVACSKEPLTVRWIEEYFKDRDNILYDIGANVGTYSLLAAKLRSASGVGVVAFEPGYASFARLCENIILNDCADRIVPVPLPLSSETRMGAFTYRTIDPGQSDHSFDTSWDENRKNKKHYLQPVLAFRLDEIIDLFNLPLPTHIKLDVDGGELDVLKGASRTLEKANLKGLLAEINHELSEPVTTLLASKGWTVTDRFQGYQPTGEMKPAWYGVFSRR